MLICDTCNVIVTKTTFCSDKCRVKHHRRNGSVTREAKNGIPHITTNVTEALQRLHQIDATVTPALQTPSTKSKWPPTLYGKPLSGRTLSCPVCYEVVPAEFTQNHNNKDHGDIGGA